MQRLKKRTIQHSVLLMSFLFGSLQIRSGVAETNKDPDVGLSELIALGIKNNPRHIS